MKFRLNLVILSLCFWCIFANAQDIYNFANNEQQKTFNYLTENLRCLVCQNQNLADSNASLAKDLRRQIYQQILQGQSTAEIQHYLVSRYGDFILFKPPLNITTLVLWFAPFALLLFGLGILLLIIKKHRHINSAKMTLS